MQHISIVHDYVVLYSKRIYQKDKRWADGRLKYFEFNRKLEVISDDGLLVSSDFLPLEKSLLKSDGPFELGESYVLPNGGVMVEFVEYNGSSSRDITSSLKKPPVKRNVSAKEQQHESRTQSSVQEIMISATDSKIEQRLTSRFVTGSKPPLTKLTSLGLNSPKSLRTRFDLRNLSSDEISRRFNLWDERVLRSNFRIQKGSSRILSLLNKTGQLPQNFLT